MERNMQTLTYDAAQVELLDRDLDVTRVDCKFSQVRSIERQSFRGRAARAIAGDRLGHASTTSDLSDDQLIRRAIKAARVAAPTGLSFPSVSIDSAHIDPALNEMSESDLCRLAQDIMQGMGHNRSNISIELELRRVRETVALHNTNGGQTHSSRVWLEGTAWVERHSGHDMLVMLDRFTTSRAGDSAPREFARRMARRLRWAHKPVEAQAGSQSVILSPSAFASLLQPMLMAFSGAHAFSAGVRGNPRRSGFAAKLGMQMFDPALSLYDDAILPERSICTPVDHEGTPGQCTALIKQGVVNSLYHNLVSAARAETRSTGNGWRWMIEPPRPAPTNIRIDRGKTRLSEMLKQLDHGLLIDLVGGSDSSVGLRGDFSRTIVLAYQVTHGKVTGFVRGVAMSGDLYRSLQNVEALGRDGYWSGNIFTPYIQLGGITVSA